MPDSTPLVRLLWVLEAIGDKPGVTAPELASRLGVSDRAVRRAVATAREAGIEIESERGPYGGYRLARHARLAPVFFTQDEAIALVTAVLAVTAGQDSDIRRSALDKVIRALPGPARRQAASVRDSAQADGKPDPLPDPSATSALVGAIAESRAVRVDYRSQSGRSMVLVVEPWALVVRHGRWYLLGLAQGPGEVRTLRVDRISAVETLRETFTPPKDLDAPSRLEAALGAGWDFETRVRFDAPLGEVAQWVRPVSGVLVEVEGGCELRGSTSNPQMYLLERLAPLPFTWRVLGGAELRDTAEQLAAVFARATTPELRSTRSDR